MGQKLMAIYEEIAKEGSIKAKMELAIKTKIPPVKAAQIEDSEEIIDLFKKAFKEIVEKDCSIS